MAADMASEGYHIPDEPRPGGLARWAVNPVWPFIAVMLGGAWLSWGWFLFNGAAIGSPSRTRERLLVAAGLLGSLLLVAALGWAVAADMLSTSAEIAYAGLGLTVWKLLITYALFTLQSQTIGLFEYYGGKLMNGVGVLLVGGFVLTPLLKQTLPGFARLALLL